MIKILCACGAGVNTSHQIKNAIQEEMEERGYTVEVDAVMIKDVTEELIKDYSIFTPIAKPELGFAINIPIIEAGAILYKIDAMSEPVFNEIEEAIKKL